MHTYIIPIAKNNKITSFVLRACSLDNAIAEAKRLGYIIVGKIVER